MFHAASDLNFSYVASSLVLIEVIRALPSRVSVCSSLVEQVTTPYPRQGHH